MAHFTPRFYIGFSVEVDANRAVFCKVRDAIHVITDQIEHLDILVARSIPKRPADNGANMLFELVDGTAVLGPVT